MGVGDPNYETAIKLKIASVGEKRHLDRLVNDGDAEVRSAVARRGFKEHLDKLVHDHHWFVRLHVAENGQKEHLDKLVHDPEDSVRRSVARKGFIDHLPILLADPNDVNRIVAIRNSPSYVLTNFMQSTSEKHPDKEISDRIADTADAIFLDHEHSYFRPPELDRAMVRNQNVYPHTVKRIARSTTDPRTMDELSKHPDPEVRSIIDERRNR